MNKRFLAILLLLLFLLCPMGCDKDDRQEEIIDNLYVDVIDVGQGDSILITFPGGDNLMIDCGSGSDYSNKKVREVLDKRKVDKIDYLVLTHPDVDHVGGTSFLADKVKINEAFLPFIYSLQNFPLFNLAREKLVSLGTNITYSSTGITLTDKDGNYLIKILSPADKDLTNSSYNEINRLNPTDSQTNNVSPIIYVQSQGVRMLFTGDAEESQEQYVLFNYKAGMYQSVNLYDIDLLKVAHHGSNDSTSMDFVDVLRPKNAVFSVGGDNIYGHPSTSVIERLINANENCNIYRTDYLGTISFTIKDGSFVKI